MNLDYSFALDKTIAVAQFFFAASAPWLSNQRVFLGQIIKKYVVVASSLAFNIQREANDSSGPHVPVRCDGDGRSCTDTAVWYSSIVRNGH